MADVAVAKQTSFVVQVKTLWNRAVHFLNRAFTLVQKVCKVVLPILAVATAIAAAIGSTQAVLVLATIKIICVIVLMVGLSTKAIIGTATSSGKFLVKGFHTGKWDYQQLLKDIQGVHDQVANDAKSTVVMRLWLLFACAVSVALFWVFEQVESGKIPYMLTGIAAGILAARGVYKFYPQATFVLFACVHLLPPLFWLRNICASDTVTDHVGSIMVMLAVLVYSVTLSQTAIQTFASFSRVGRLEASTAASIRRLIRTCISLFVAYLGATSYWRAARESALLLFFWQLSDLLNSVEFVISATQTAEEWWTQPSTVSASDVANFFVQHAAALIHAAKTQAIPVWMLGLVSCVRIGIASIVVLNIFTTCGTPHLLALVLAALSWIFAVCRDAAFLRDVRVGNIDKDPLRRLKYCLNML